MFLKKLFISSWGYLLLSLSSCSDSQHSVLPAPDILTKDEVLVFLDKYDKAWNTKKSLVVDSLYGSQYKYFTSAGGISSRARNLEILAADYYSVESANRTEIEVYLEGNTAIVSSRWQGDGTWKGVPFSDNQRCGLVLQKQGKVLKLLSEHCVDISTEPAF